MIPVAHEDNPIFSIDFYKENHINQYPENVTRVFSNWTPRSTRIPGTTHIVNFGLTFFIKKILMEGFKTHFFGMSEDDACDQYSEVMKSTLPNPTGTHHIRKLHQLGFLPLEIWAIPEGNSVRLNQPMFIVVNTHGKDFAWLPNYIESVASAMLWKPMTSATTAKKYREIGLKWAKAAGERDFSFIDWQFHDFSFRGMGGMMDAIISGLGHLLFFKGTDTVPAIIAANRLYGAGYSVGGSIAATEHSVMCAGGEGNELETMRRIINQQKGSLVSIVSDTWDLWRVLTEFVPKLKPDIDKLVKLVIRPDSGDPVKILCGNPDFASANHQYNCDAHPAFYGAVQLLAKARGTVDNPTGRLPLINNSGLIYGDAITISRADEILGSIVNAGFSPYVQVFGVGSYTYVYVTRDTHGFAMKATAVEKIGRGVVPIFKKPITDSGGKFSHRGLLAMYDEDLPGINGITEYRLLQNVTEDEMRNCAFERVFFNGDLLIDPKFSTIRERARKGL